MKHLDFIYKLRDLNLDFNPYREIKGQGGETIGPVAQVLQDRLDLDQNAIKIVQGAFPFPNL